MVFNLQIGKSVDRQDQIEIIRNILDDNTSINFYKTLMQNVPKAKGIRADLRAVKKKYIKKYTKNPEVLEKLDYFDEVLSILIKNRESGKKESLPILRKAKKIPYTLGKVEKPEAKTLNELYDGVLANDFNSYEELLAHANKRVPNAKKLRMQINNRYGYKSDHPMYIKEIKIKGDVLPNFKDHFRVLGFVKKLTKIIDSKERLIGGKAFQTFLSKNDPKGQDWVRATGLNNHLDAKNHLKTGLNQKDYLNIFQAVNKRRGLIGEPKLKTPSMSKASLKQVLIPVNYDTLMNLYNTYPNVERPELEMAKERLETARSKPPIKRSQLSAKQIAKDALSALKGTKSTKGTERPEAQDVETEKQIIKDLESKFNTKALSTLLDLEDDIIKVNLKPIKIQESEEITGLESQNKVQKMITDSVMTNIIKKKLNELNKKSEFRVNTPVGRMNILQKSLIGYKPTIADYNEGLKLIDNAHFINTLQKHITGKSLTTEFSNIINSVSSIPHLSDDKLDELETLFEEYNDDILPDLQKEYSETRGLSVDAPADVRMLPPGVKMTPVDIKEVQEERLNKKINVLNYQNDIKTQTRILNDPAASKANKREALGKIEDIKSKLSEAKLKDDQKKKYQSVRESASKRVGALRPHFKNDTEKNVKDAIGETPEQQIQDFKNWFVFDIPKDQTGQGSSNKNPLVAQNELRQKFIGEGNIFDNFNQAYDIKPGIDNRKDFYTQHSKLTKTNVAQGLKNAKISSEEDKFLAKFDKENNGLFTQDQTKQEHNKWQNIYQKPGRFFQDPTYPLAENSNTSLLVSDFKKNLLYFIEP